MHSGAWNGPQIKARDAFLPSLGRSSSNFAFSDSCPFSFFLGSQRLLCPFGVPSCVFVTSGGQELSLSATPCERQWQAPLPGQLQLEQVQIFF